MQPVWYCKPVNDRGGFALVCEHGELKAQRLFSHFEMISAKDPWMLLGMASMWLRHKIARAA